MTDRTLVWMICSINPHMQIKKRPVRKGNLLLGGIVHALNRVVIGEDLFSLRK